MTIYEPDPVVELPCGCLAEFQMIRTRAGGPFPVLLEIRWEACHEGHDNPTHRTRAAATALEGQARRLITEKQAMHKPTADELVPLVEAMLTAQQEYFRTKSQAALDRAKRLEKHSRDWIARYRSMAEQPTLFPADNAGRR